MTSLPKHIDEIRQPQTTEGAQTGRIVEIDRNGCVWVDFTGNRSGPILAKVSGSIKSRLVSNEINAFSQVIIVFEDGDPERPIVLDSIEASIGRPDANEDIALQMDKTKKVEIEGRTLTFNAKDEIELRCGKASIKLTRSGKIKIRGAHVINRSTGVNRLQGGSVRIN